MKRIWIDHIQRHVTLGAVKTPDKHAPMLKLGDYLDLGQLPPSPELLDWSPAAMASITSMDGNDTVGDCCEAEEAHYIGVITGNANKLFVYTTAATLAMYSAVTGYVQGNPATDQGTDPVTILNYFVKNKYADGSINAGYASVNATSMAEVMFALYAFGNVKMWFGIPDSIANNLGSLKPGFVWDVTAGSPDQNNGHCIGSCGYNPTQIQAVAISAKGLIIMTWGMMGLITWAAVAAWFIPSAGGGLATRVNADWLVKASAKTPSGFGAADLASDLSTMFGGQIVNQLPQPTPTPAPTPATAPTSPPTLAQAQAAIQAAFAGKPALIVTAQAAQLAANALPALYPVSKS